MNQDATIILCGGPINYSGLPIGTNRSNAMIPVNGKPVIGWILDDLLAKNIEEVTVVLQAEAVRLHCFLEWAYNGRMRLTLAPLSHPGTIIQSLQAGLAQNPAAPHVRVILGDTLIRDPFAGEQDFVYVGEVAESHRWCLAVSNDQQIIIDYIDKQEQIPTPKMALAGYYHFRHGAHLRQCVAESVARDETELSHLLRRYGAVYPLQARPVCDWYDFGHIDNLVDARRRLLRPRYFNSLTVNPVLNTITKISDHNEKLRDELNWYLCLPDELKVLSPRIISHQEQDGRLRIVQEYYGYPSLAELYVYGDLHAEVWASILRHVMRIHQEFRRYAGQVSPESCQTMYLHKTRQRLDSLTQQEPYWADWLAQETIGYNGRELLNIYPLWPKIESYVQHLLKTAETCIVHGDFCFSNILFDLNNQIIRLIDPRGSFGVKGIYGDGRYDIAKLRHSACSLYDYIMADMFELEETGGGFVGRIYRNGIPQVVAAAFDEMIQQAGYNRDDVRFIEGLLFVSMTPLHYGNVQRQRMMYLTGLALLNEVL